MWILLLKVSLPTNKIFLFCISPHVFNVPALWLLWATESFEPGLNQEPTEAWESRAKKIVEQPGPRSWHTPDTTRAGLHVRMYTIHT